MSDLALSVGGTEYAVESLEQAVYFLKHEEVKDEFSAKGLKEAKSKLDVMKLPREERLAYQRYLEDVGYLLRWFGVAGDPGDRSFYPSPSPSQAVGAQ